MVIPPPFLALIAASLLGGSYILAKIAMRRIDPPLASWYAIGFSMITLWALASFQLELDWFLNPWVGYFALIGVLQPWLSLTLSFEATARLGPTISSTVASTFPLFSLIGALLILQEHITLPIVAGTLAIVTGIMALSWQGNTRREWATIALIFPLATAFIRGFAFLGTKYGMTHFHNPLMAALTAYSAGFLAGLVFFLIRRGKIPLGHRWSDIRWVALAGCGNGIAFYLVFQAFTTGKLMVVTPIVATFPLFTMVYSTLFFREETINRRTLFGALLIVPGVIVINIYR